MESLKLVKLSSRAFQVSWSSPFDGNSPIKRYLLQYKTSQGKLAKGDRSIDRNLIIFNLKHTDNWQSAKEVNLEASRTEAFVRNLSPMTDYELRMSVINDIGQSKWSGILTIATEEEGKLSDIKLMTSIR